MKLSLLAFGAHPDDVELGAGGILKTHADLGYKTGIIDLTEGELGTRGTVKDRYQEASDAGAILGLSARENLKMQDGFFDTGTENQLAVIRMLRKYQPDIVLINAPDDRHPDHPRAAKLLLESVFKSGLRHVVTELEGEPQQPWRPTSVYHYIQFYPLTPTLAIDITSAMEAKMAAVKAYKTQFYDPNSTEPKTVIAGKHFLDMVAHRCTELGQQIGVDYAEGLIAVRIPGAKDLHHLL